MGSNPKSEIRNPKSDALAYLEALPRFAGVQDATYRPGLERIEALLEAMGRPHEAFASVHVAGTNGKGSTASFLAAIATAGGRKVGLHTSPHLCHVTERMRVNGRPASAGWLAGAVNRHRSLFDEVEPSFFEATVALSFLYFAEEAVDLAVVEVGLGGRLDATNVLQPRLACITTLGLEHTDLLGATLPAIAREKAGILKRGVPAVTAVEQPEALAVLRERAAAQEAPLHRVQDEVEVLREAHSLTGSTLRVRTPLRTYDGLRVGLGGRHQQRNALLALRAAELLFDEVQHGAQAVHIGLRGVRRLTGLRGRFEVLQEKPLIACDVAHNPDGLATALDLLRLRPEEGRLCVLLGLMRDKDAAAMARLLAEAQATTILPARLDSPRALPAEALAEVLEAHGVPTGAPCRVADGLQHFHRIAAPADALLATGSHLVAEQVLCR